MSHAYGLGIEHALYALTWAAGVLTVVLAVALLLLAVLWAVQPLERTARRHWTSRRLHREASRSGRA